MKGRDWERISQILDKDPRFAPEAYRFLSRAFAFTHQQIERERGTPRPVEHVSGRQLALGIRDYAREKLGFLAKTVFESWGVRSTSDWGAIVFNLIDAHLLSKSPEDTIDDFANIYDFAEAFEKDLTLIRE
jgi:uncharacterized repeat protein (TIGR04138 family)